MKIGNFEDVENSLDVGDSSLESMEDIEGIDNIEDSENTENIDETEDVERGELPENENTEKDEETSAMDKIKGFFKSLFDKNDTDDDVSEIDKVTETSDGEKTEENLSRPSWELSPEEKAVVLEKQAQIATDVRAKYNLDEHGQKIDNGESTSDGNADPDVKMHGEGGERTLYSDLMHLDYDEDELEL